MKRSFTFSKCFGFTLIEILLVISILIILISMMTHPMGMALKKAKIQKAQTDLFLLVSAVKLYHNEIGFNPRGISEKYLGKILTSNEVYGSNDSIQSTFGPFFQFQDSNSSGISPHRLFLDPWGIPYEYRGPSGSKKGVFLQGQKSMDNGFPIVFSSGPDTVLGNEDDIGSW